MKEIDYLGTVSGYRVPDKFERTGLKAVKSKYVDAPVIVGSPVIIECELIEFVETENFTTVLAKVVNMAADESVLDENGIIPVYYSFYDIQVQESLIGFDIRNICYTILVRPIKVLIQGLTALNIYSKIYLYQT